MPASHDDSSELIDTAAPGVAGRNAPGPITGDVAGAMDRLEKAQEAYEEAEDALADQEGRIAVLEAKLAAVNRDAGDEAAGETWQQVAAREDLAQARRAFRRAGTKLERAEQHRDDAAAQPPQLRFASVDLFVERFVLPNWVHKYVASRIHWCEKWWSTPRRSPGWKRCGRPSR